MITDLFTADLARAATARQPQAHRPGTNAGRASVVRLFLAFCYQARLDYRRISHINVCWYIEYLARHSYSPGAITNSISHLRTFYKMSSLQDAPLHHYRVGLALKAVSVSIRRQPLVKLPVTPTVLKAALRQLHTHQDFEALRLALLIMFLGFLRQSSVAPHTRSSFDQSRHLTRADALPTAKGLAIMIKWSKTMQKAADLTTIILPPTKDRSLCPLRAYDSYMAQAPRAPPGAPLLTYKDGNPLTIRYIVNPGHWP